MKRYVPLALGLSMIFALVLGVSSASAAAKTKPPLVSGPVTSVTIRYDHGLLTKNKGYCKQSSTCREEIRLSHLPPATYGAWQATHLKDRLNHLRLVKKEAFVSPSGMGQWVPDHLQSSSRGREEILADQSGCEFALTRDPHALWWVTTQFFQRLSSC